jgi:predicted Zn-dependent peptidase
MRRPVLLGYLRKHYSTGSALLVAAGRVRHRHVVRAAKRSAVRLRTGRRPDFSAARTRQAAPKINLLTKPTEQTQIALGIRTCSRHDPRRYALRLLNAILGENMSSRLFQVIREDRGLAYSIYSTPSFFADTGDLVISAGLDTENLSRTIKLIARELRRFRQALISPAELRRARDYAIGQMDLSLESTENQMNWLGEQLIGYGMIFTQAEIKRRLGKVSAAEIRAAARDFFRPERMNLALVSPLKKHRGLMAALTG